jgi:hypothetical protein
MAESSDSAFRRVVTPTTDRYFQLVDGGKIIGDEPLEVMRERHLRVRAELPLEALKMSRGEPVMETLFGGTGGDVRNPCRTEPSGELRAAGSVADVIAGPTKEL